MATVQQTRDGDAAYLADLGRWDWLEAEGASVLHGPVTVTYDPDLWAAVDVTFACGWHVERAYIPGLLTRMGAKRCSRCCDRMGYPRGVGSPKNDDECRRIMGLL